MFADPAKAPLPSLREEIALLRGPDGLDGWPTYTLHDPVRNRFFRIAWPQFEMLARWAAGRADALIARLRAETVLEATPAEVQALVGFLQANGLTRSETAADLRRLEAQSKAGRRHWASWLLHNYLFFRIPLLKPDRFLRATLPVAGLLFRRGFLLVSLLAGLVGLYLASRQWDSYVQTFLYLFNLQGLFWYGLALGAAKVAHEFGHAYALRRQGAPVPTMGLAFLVLWPVLYTDTSAAWMLAGKRARLGVAAAGVATELVLAAYALLAWSLLPDGPARTAAFLLTTVTLAGTLTVNASPLMKFDGYYFLADGLGVDNLQDRSFALARWHLRRLALGLDEPPPESSPPRHRRILLGYAYAAWIYRFFLFLGIALLVYHYFFKVLGVFLMAVEVVWFIGRPIGREALEWWRRRKALRANPRLLASSGLAVALLGLLFLPWRGTVEAPALWQAGLASPIFPPWAGHVEAVLVGEGQAVVAGQPLIRLATADLDHRIGQAGRTIETLRWQIERQGAHAKFLEQGQVIERYLAAAGAELAGLAEDRARSLLAAPVAGRIVDLADGLRPGRWIGATDRLALLVGEGRARVEAYLAEADLGQVAPGATGRFVPDDPDLPDLPAMVSFIDSAAARVLADPAFSAAFGGPLPVIGEEEDKHLIPRDTLYRSQLSADPAAYPFRTVRGRVLLDGPPRSLAHRLWRTAAAAFVRESGF
ncbi:MAG: HlyD family efflux transporter periplasmic adaptor subunit [Magnetospirillum sp. WYHS-4]